MPLLPMRLPRRHRPIAIALLVVTGALLAACTTPAAVGTAGNGSSDRGPGLAPVSAMSPAVRQAPPAVQEAYRFAVANPAILKSIPCYCGCGTAGHTSSYDCYVSGTSASGGVELDAHALGCSICVDIVRDVMGMANEGKSVLAIRAAIDQTYSQYGPSNMPEAQRQG